MDITIKQKKLIFIILASALLILIFTFGINTYYKDKKNKKETDLPVTYNIMEIAKSVSESCISDELENQYRICCSIEGGIKDGLAYDCSSQKSFLPGQNIYIVFDTSKFNIPYDPYFLRMDSDLNYEESKFILYKSDSINRKEINLIKAIGSVPEEGESFVLLKLSVYPDDKFDKKDEQVILYREAKIFKE